MIPDSRIPLSSLGILLFLCALSGVLLALSFPKISLCFLAWVSMVPFLWAMFYLQKTLSFKQTLCLGFTFGFFHFLVGLYWIDIVLEKYGGLPVWTSIPVLILLCGYLALYGVAFALGVRFLPDSSLFPSWLSLPSLWVVLEWLRGKLVTGFPWNLMAYSQGDVGWLRQIADITGAYGVSWLIVLVNVLIARAFIRRKDIIGWLCLVVALSASFWYGSKTLSSNFSCRDTDLKVAIIQGNIDQAQKWDEAFRDATIEIYHQLSLEAARSYKLDLIVWPESAMPFFYGFSPDLTVRVDSILDEANVPVLFGSIGIAGFGKDAKSLNKAYLVKPGGFIIGDYSKEHLVPFGEYVPLQPFLFFVHKLVPTAGDFVPGQSSGVISWENEAIGMLICYEAIFPELARNRVLNGASMIVNISNDAWFGKSSAPYQHLEIARWRAVETRRPMVRSTNTGISAFIDPFGNIVSTLGLFQSGVLVGSVKPCSAQTFYVRYGDVFVAFCALIMLLASLYSLAKVKIKKSA